MSKRFNLENQIYFITSKIFKNKKIFDNGWCCKLLIDVLKECKNKYGFKLYGYVIMPDHIHLLIEPAENDSISNVIHKIKGNFAYRCLIIARNHKGSATRDNHHSTENPKRVSDPSWVGEKRQRIRHQPIWQKSFYDHAIRNQQDFLEKLNYIHKNPLKHAIAKNPDQYHYSSYQNYYLQNNKLIKIDGYEI